jgi:hypothetical protein
VSESRTTISMDQYTSDVFASLVGQLFHFHQSPDADDPSIDLELIAVESSPHARGAPGRQPFSLLFALRRGEAPQQSTLYLRHEAFERCAWFVNRVLVPGRDARTPYYEAVFA